MGSPFEVFQNGFKFENGFGCTLIESRQVRRILKQTMADSGIYEVRNRLIRFGCLEPEGPM